MSSSSTPAQTQQTSTTTLPAWVSQASEENYNYAKQVADTPLEQYTGQTVAAPSTYTTQAKQLAAGNVGSTDPLTSDAANLYRTAAGPLNISEYYNPFTEDVINRSTANAEDALKRQLLGVNDAAGAASSFGGSRHGIESGVTRAEGIRGIGDMVAKLRAQGFDTATSTALARQAGQRDSASGLLSTASTKKAGEAQDYSTLLNAGATDEAYFQKLLDAEAAKFYEKRDYPTEQLNIRLAALGMSPYGKTETSSKTSTSEDKGTDWSTLGLGSLKTLGSLYMLSDRSMKTDIEKLTGGSLPMYAYRYKGDPKSYPKVVGPMAQDVEKIAPKAVKKVGGKRVVNLSNLMEVLS